MNNRYSLDRACFDALLADAFAVQESGLDRESLATLVEIQKFVANKPFDLNETMRMIAQHVLTLSSADGVAVALLDGDSLVYVAGAGSAVKDVGRHIAAVLKVSSAQDARHEILRVDNAETDMRIEAAICRQFGASSLLMLPICQDHVLIGVLQVLFRNAHSFVDREIRVCRLMVDTLEDAISCRKEDGTKQETLDSVERMDDDELGNVEQTVQLVTNLTGESKAHVSAVEQNVFRGPDSTTKRDHSAMLLAEQSHASRVVVNRRGNHLWANPRISFESQSKLMSGADFWYLSAFVSAAVVLTIAVWLSNGSHPSTSIASGVPIVRGSGQSTVTQPFSVDQETKPYDRALREGTRSAAVFKRVRVSPDEIDYVAEDVTIRRFTTRSRTPQMHNGVKEIQFGDDVTVRYFATPAVVVSQSQSREGTPNHKTSASEER